MSSPALMLPTPSMSAVKVSFLETIVTSGEDISIRNVDAIPRSEIDDRKAIAKVDHPSRRFGIQIRRGQVCDRRGH